MIQSINMAFRKSRPANIAGTQLATVSIY